MIKDRFKPVYFNIAREIASLSYAKRLKVGAIAVKNGTILSYGFNGSPTGWDNACEDELKAYDERETYFEREDWTFNKETKQYTRLKTKQEIIHAEQNLIYKLAKSGEKSDGAVIFCTHAPCIECAKAIFMSGITHFYYEEEYRSNDGLEFLEKCGVIVEKRS
jgi:dCMP deaminase